MDTRTSIFTCDVCPKEALYYEKKGEYNERRRCKGHLPSWIKSCHKDSVGYENGKYWVYSTTGISLKMKRKADEKAYERRDSNNIGRV